MKIVIPGEVICKKNNLAAIKIGGKCRVLPMSKYTKYEKASVNYLKGLPPWKGEYPCIVEIFIYRKTKRKFDFDNMQATINDILVKANVLRDDSMEYVIPKIDRHGWAVDKENPRAVINIYEYELDQRAREAGL